VNSRRTEKFVSSTIESRGISPSKQLGILDSRLGVGVGATKERARLHALLTASLEEKESRKEKKKKEVRK